MNKKINNNLAKVIISLIVCVFSLNTIMPSLSWAQSVSSQSFSLPQAGSMLALSDSFRPTVIKGLKIYPENPFKFDFIVDTQDSGLLGKDLQEESNNLIKYFLTTLTVPNKDLWVNLSPYEKGRIMTEGFGTTQMGRDLLAQDYLLKQITSSLMYPEEAIGEKFWEKSMQQHSQNTIQRIFLSILLTKFGLFLKRRLFTRMQNRIRFMS